MNEGRFLYIWIRTSMFKFSKWAKKYFVFTIKMLWSLLVKNMGVDHLIVLSKLLFWIPFIIMTSAFFYLFKRPNKYLLLSACPMIYFIHKIRGFYYYDSGISLFCYEIGLLASAIFFIFVLEYFRKKWLFVKWCW